MRVFVTGGTGAIGRYAIAALVAGGHDVSALARGDDKAKLIYSMGAKPILVSLFDRPAMTLAVAGHDAIINLATALPATRDFRKLSAWKENIRIRVEGSATIVDAALDAGVPKLFQESVSMIYQDGGADWIDESWPTDSFPMAQSNLAAEKSATRFTAMGGAGVILRFGWFYGRGATHSEEFLALVRQRRISIMMGAANGYVSSIHVADGGRAIETALGVRAGIYNIVDDEPLTKCEFADALAAAANRKYYVRAPGRLALLLGDNTTSLTRSLRVSNQRFKDAAGWTPTYPSAREGWQAMAAS